MKNRPALFCRFKVSSFACLLLSALLLLPLALPVMAGVRINEFMADNSGVLVDQDGANSDWIELYNTGPGAANLGGWHLTDDAANLSKWTFPATNLLAGNYLIVFASGKDRATNGAELHANFSLSKDGEFLALVRPDGTTIEQSFSPAFPAQFGDVAYGIGRVVTTTPLVVAGAAAKFLIPTNSTLANTWTLFGFNDSGWNPAATGIGFDAVNGTNSGAGGNIVLNLDFNDASSLNNTQPGFASMSLAVNPATNNGIITTITAIGGATLDSRLRPTPANSPPYLTQAQIYDDFIFAVGPNNGNGLRIQISGLQANQDYFLKIWSFDSTSIGARVSDWIETASGTTNKIVTAYNFDGSIPPTEDDDDTFTGSLHSSPTGTLQIEGRRSGGTSHGVFLNALQLAQFNYSPYITTDIGGAMSNKNATAYIRLPFTVANPGLIQTLKLRIKYDDGFVAYLNGQMVASRNAPASPQWNSAATAGHPYTNAVVYEEITFTNAPGLLIAGNNLLAIQGLNATAADRDFLILPELDGIAVSETSDRYLSPATPGTANSPGFLGIVADPQFSVSRGFFDTPFSVAITSTTAGAQIYWTTNGSTPSMTNGTLYAGPVAINGTTFLRAGAFKPEYLPAQIVTHSYIFLNQVLQQAAVQSGYPTTWQGGFPADYEMDPNVVTSPNYGATLNNDLRSIPTLSIVTGFDGLWGPVNGIYNHSTSEGELWERPASVELINSDGSTAFAVNCGLRSQGNASRDNIRTPKHSFRLLFKNEYGPGKLDYDWFSNSVDKFDNIVLRACFTDSWGTRYSDTTAVPGGMGTRYRPEGALYLRDVWVKDSLKDMGWLSGRGNFVHLYINGLYWGLYNPCERLDESYFASHLGGEDEDWDVMRDFSEVLSGTKADWSQMISLVNAGVTNETAYQAVGQLVDIDNLIDYMMLHIYAEAEDWPQHNWYAAHRRATNGLPATKWIFLSWDQEITLDQLVRRNQINVSNDDTPARIYSQLRAYPEFRRQFGDRIQKHLFNNGALTSSNNIARLMARTAQIDRAIVGESARWGDAREFATPSNPATGQTFTRDEWWVPELQKLYTNFFQTLNETNIARFRAGNLYPSLGAPAFSQFGGMVTAGFALVLSHTNASGTIFYTMDGADPRVYGTGTVAPSASAYNSPITFNGAAQVRARVFSAGQWSALVEATFFPPQDLSKLSLTELMYNPPNFGSTNSDELEFLELKNAGTNVLNLSGLTFSAGITFTFTNGTMLVPGQFFVLGRNAAALGVKYPGLSIRGIYTGKLDNGGEAITLSLPTGGTVFSVTYSDSAPWPAAADGSGFSIVPKNAGASQAPDNAANWRASSAVGGSPGADDPASTIPGIVINEILPHTDPPQKDSIELYNPTTNNVDISGWYLTDDSGVPAKYRIPNGTIMPARRYVYFDEDQFNPTPGVGNSFAFKSTGDKVYLFSATTNNQLTGYSHGLIFGAMFNGVSFGRYVNSVGDESFPMQKAVSLSLSNAGPRIGPIVINEINYHPAAGGDEFIELLNLSSSNVPLFDTANPTNTWKFGGLGYTLPTNITVGSGGMVLLVATNPASFRAKYSVPVAVQILGPVSGTLQDNGELLELQGPDSPNLDVVPYVTLEGIRYNNKSPWPSAADGTGMSLQRVDGSAYGDDPNNWLAATPTPGRTFDTADSDGDGIPDLWEFTNGTNPYENDANDDPDGDGFTNYQEFLAGTNPNDANSNLKLAEIGIDHGTVTLKFLAVSKHSYSVIYKESVSDPKWTKLADVPAQSKGDRVAVVNDVEPITGARFYRLITPAVP